MKFYLLTGELLIFELFCFHLESDGAFTSWKTSAMYTLEFVFVRSVRHDGLQLMVCHSWKIDNWVNQKQFGQEFFVYDPHLFCHYLNRSTSRIKPDACGTVSILTKKMRII